MFTGGSDNMVFQVPDNSNINDEQPAVDENENENENIRTIGISYYSFSVRGYAFIWYSQEQLDVMADNNYTFVCGRNLLLVAFIVTFCLVYSTPCVQTFAKSSNHSMVQKVPFLLLVVIGLLPSLSWLVATLLLLTNDNICGSSFVELTYSTQEISPDGGYEGLGVILHEDVVAHCEPNWTFIWVAVVALLIPSMDANGLMETETNTNTNAEPNHLYLRDCDLDDDETETDVQSYLDDDDDETDVQSSSTPDLETGHNSDSDMNDLD
eukprot:scaffold3444_cov50-Attheya_sp.AAC.4